MSLFGSGSAAQNNGSLFGNLNTNNAQTTTTTSLFGNPAASQAPAPDINNAQTTTTTTFSFGTPAASQAPTANEQTGQSTLTMRPGGFSSASTTTHDTSNTNQPDTQTPESDNTKIKRSGCMSIFLFPPNINEPDPNGDVTLIVTPRKRPQALFSETPSVSPTEQQATRFRVSSRHLILASTYFESRLSTRWPEGEELKNKGSVELQIPDADPNAFLIILNIIHGRLNRVPQAVSLERLTEMAILTDYFQCHEPLGLFPSKWVDALRSPFPSSVYFGGINWILISWVFGIDDIFTSTTKLAQRQLNGDLVANEFGIPIPGNIRDGINKARSKAVSMILEYLDKGQQELENRTFCGFDCDCAQLGALIKQRKQQRLYSPTKELGFTFHSVDDLVTKVSSFRYPKCLQDPLHSAPKSCFSKSVGWKFDPEKYTSFLNGLSLDEPSVQVSK